MEQSELRRRDAANLRAPARRGPRRRRDGAPVVPLPHAGRSRAPAPARAPNLRIVKGAYLEPTRSPTREKRGRRSRVRRARRAGPARRRVHRRRDPRRGDHPRGPGVRSARGNPTRPLRVPDAVRRPPGLQRSSRPRATRCSSQRRSGRTGTRTSCAGSPSAPRTSVLPRRTSSDDVLSSRRRPTSSSSAAASIGTSVAFHLAEAGVDVCLLERDELAGGSTSRAAGGVRRSSPTR